MKLYHGSPMVIRKPELTKGKLNNDYGQGFYCTENPEMAKEWACKGKEPPAFANTYELDLTDLSVLDLSKAPYTVLDWIAVLLKNRTFEIDLEIAHEVRDYLIENFLPPIDQADVIIGYRADDSYFNYATTFVNNGLSLTRLNDALRLGKLGLQVALRTEKAFERLSFVSAEEVEWTEYHARYVRRDNGARDEWRAVRATKESPTATILAYDIVRQGITRNDKRLSAILPR